MLLFSLLYFNPGNPGASCSCIRSSMSRRVCMLLFRDLCVILCNDETGHDVFVGHQLICILVQGATSLYDPLFFFSLFPKGPVLDLFRTTIIGRVGENKSYAFYLVYSTSIQVTLGQAVLASGPVCREGCACYFSVTSALSYVPMKCGLSRIANA